MKRNETELLLNETGVSKQMEVFTSIYSLRSEDGITMNDIEMESGGVYTILIGKRGKKYVSYKSYLMTSLMTIGLTGIE